MSAWGERAVRPAGQTLDRVAVFYLWTHVLLTGRVLTGAMVAGTGAWIVGLPLLFVASEWEAGPTAVREFDGCDWVRLAFRACCCSVGHYVAMHELPTSVVVVAWLAFGVCTILRPDLLN